jgi:hypothetical protein
MTWEEIVSLQRDRMDLESKGMNDSIPVSVSANKLDFEMGQSKQCLAAHEVNNVTVFCYSSWKGIW